MNREELINKIIKRKNQYKKRIDENKSREYIGVAAVLASIMIESSMAIRIQELNWILRELGYSQSKSNAKGSRQ